MTVPLTVSPFVTLPTAATLPYTYKSMPSTLPPPSTGITGATNEKPKYVVSQSGHAAHPDDIIASCKALQAHITKMQEAAERELHELDERIRAHSEARLLEPERKPGASGEAEVAGQFAEMSISGHENVSEMAVDHGEELDRAFGGPK
ncbi:hypothetical protein RRF57_006726 [Xylaria bambusicola]|uniref:Uncharacterized protein n=1 Tax=Xylaria bambusicola TaxID=326684 RepID=A0AAN7ZA02_9PEZI